MSRYITSIVALCCFTACGQHLKSEAKLEHFDLDQPVVFKVPEALREISGITFKGNDSFHIYAQQDEEGLLFVYNLQNGETKEFAFGKKGDYEDIAFVKDEAILLRSDGSLFRFSFANEAEAAVKEYKHLLPKAEYESMYAFEDGRIIILCKHCAEEKGSLTGYSLQLSEADISLQQSFKINTRDAFGKGKKNSRLAPSAVTFNKDRKEWLILSSVQKMLVVADEQWNITQAVPLDPHLFNQPEGMAFDAAGNLYISNEAGDSRNGTILKFNYIPSGQ